MGIRVYRSIFLLLVILALIFVGACSNTSNDIVTTTKYVEDNTLTNEINGAEDQLFPMLKLKERTSWNIDIEFLETTKSGFKIRICDNDNQGFYYNPIYFVLEYKREDGWEKLTIFQEKLANEDFVFVYPDKNKNFVDTNNINMFSLVPDFELKNGCYRITKVLSGREFFTEFEITDQTS